MLGELLGSRWGFHFGLLPIIFREGNLRDFRFFLGDGREKETATDTILRFNILKNRRNTMFFASFGSLALLGPRIDFDRELIEVVLPVLEGDVYPIYGRLRLSGGDNRPLWLSFYQKLRRGLRGDLGRSRRRDNQLVRLCLCPQGAVLVGDGVLPVFELVGEHVDLGGEHIVDVHLGNLGVI